MTTDVETTMRDSAPRVTSHPDVFLAALSVSEESASAVRSTRARRSRMGWAIGAVTVVAVGGTTAAAAATHSLWWSSPHNVVAEAVPITGTDAPAKTVSCILEADYAAGVDGSTPEALSTFQLAQNWLAVRPVVVDVPVDAHTLSVAERETAAATLASDSSEYEAAVASQIALDFKAIDSTREAITSAAEADHDSLTGELSTYLLDNGGEPTLVIVGETGGLCEVGR